MPATASGRIAPPGRGIRAAWSALALLAPTLGLLASCGPPQPAAPILVDAGRVSGKIVRIDAEEQRMELADAGRRFSILFNAQTLIKSGAGELAASDIREGDRVVVSLDDGGSGEARLITLAGPIRLPAGAPPEEEELP